VGIAKSDVALRQNGNACLNPMQKAEISLVGPIRTR
jgi:hypothetical protein